MRKISKKRYSYLSLIITLLFVVIAAITLPLLAVRQFYPTSDHQDINNNPQNYSRNAASIQTDYTISSDQDNLIPSSATADLPANLLLNSSNAVLMDDTDKTVLLDKNSTARIYPASMTKIMTAIIVLEQTDDLNESVTLDQDIFNLVYSANAMTAGFLPGETVSINDLLYGLLLSSGAECAIGLAQQIAGSEREFAGLMNEKAEELGMHGSHFVNATGLHDPNHYSTVEDIAKLLEYAIQNDQFYKIFTTRTHTTAGTNLQPEGITCYSTLFSNLYSSELDKGIFLGGKTGYTDEAGQCLASLAKINDKRYILVTCGAPGNSTTQNLHIEDAVTVYSSIKLN